MSLNKTLDRLFDEIRREARRNPGFADRLDAVLRAHDSKRDVDEALIEEVSAPVSSPASGGSGSRDLSAVALAKAEARDEGGSATPLSQPASRPASSPARGGAKRAAAASPATPPQTSPSFNPVGFFQREGADALAATLETHDRAALIALIAEHNLDPGEETTDLDRDALAAHVLAQAKRRAERDSKLFDY
jgi:hypothetical protein